MRVFIYQYTFFKAVFQRLWNRKNARFKVWKPLNNSSTKGPYCSNFSGSRHIFCVTHEPPVEGEDCKKVKETKAQEPLGWVLNLVKIKIKVLCVLRTGP